VSRAVSIRDVAREAGVSPGTVSRALNGYADVSAETRRRIEAAADRLGYRPAAAARTLRTHHSGLVGALLGWCDNEARREHAFLRPVLGCVADELQAAGFDLLVTEAPRPDSEALTAFVGRCLAREAEGLLLLSVEGIELDAVSRAGLPVVGVDLELDLPRSAVVTSDGAAGSALAVEHLLALGHRRIAAIAGPQLTLPARERLAGYRRALTEAGLPVHDDYVREGDYHRTSGAHATAELMALPEPPTAIVAASDGMAAGALGALAAHGRRVPADVSVVGYDDLPLATVTEPPLTTVRSHQDALGAAAAAALLGLIDDGGAPTHIRVPVELVVRGSTAPAVA
jgi:LacI family transcriptional regulator